MPRSEKGTRNTRNTSLNIVGGTGRPRCLSPLSTEKSAAAITDKMASGYLGNVGCRDWR